MHNQSGPLVNDQQIIVLVDDVQSDGLGRGADFGLGPRLQRDRFSPRDGVSRSPGPTVDSDCACEQPLFQTAA
jgi:hypothetical protein